MKNQITKADAVLRILNTKGRFFTVFFTKKNGEKRRMTARLGVSSHLKGTGKRPYNPFEKGLIHVFDTGKLAYRSINVNTVEKIVFGGETFKVI